MNDDYLRRIAANSFGDGYYISMGGTTMEIIIPFVLGMICCGMYCVAAGVLLVFCVIAGARAEKAMLDLINEEANDGRQ